MSEKLTYQTTHQDVKFIDRSYNLPPQPLGPPQNTHQELEFINNLGMYSIANVGRKSLLKHYIKAAKKRDNWGRIDKVKAVNHAVFLLSQIA